MFDLFSGLPLAVGLSLVLALALVLVFEFINGFHDTANAVATVIYTKAMPPHLAVLFSGICNFLGVLLGGVGVAYAIVHLLPVELLLDLDSGRSLAMAFSMLVAAIVWNLGTWYFGIPASSSHTLIGAILGVGLANALLTDVPVGAGVNWGKAIDIGLSLVISPLAGFIVAAALLLGFKKAFAGSKMHKTPEQRRAIDNKKHPPFWNRLVLVLSAMCVSFVHGSNDGQKGIGLIMLVLISIVPAKYVLDPASTPYQVQRTVDAVAHLSDFYQRKADTLGDFLALQRPPSLDPLQTSHCNPQDTLGTIQAVRGTLSGVHTYDDLPPETRVRVRRYLLCLDDTARKVAGMDSLSLGEKTDLRRLRGDLTATTEYAPLWVIVAVALALGAGTMLGWRRVVLTVGEKIGRQGMTYAQGMAAQITAVAAIGVANVFSLPVSTTQVLSSGVAGTMVANRSGLHNGTVRIILLAWLLTFPASMLLSAGLFSLAVLVLGM
ncbi:inorganic phosphate transporter [Castellaniella daejeonensis]|jgi:low-affinity inorganic phosphate transporter|uniref:Phosphate transporter n=1 Tax=Castellaniella daejeonensis TaxID=659013 RepID=A0ABN0TKE8_9BURK|nr:inorganic phosphate transporter [Castellaniella sp.]HET8702592.1 inorganic phosphate transporter [Castellaniella sp.]